MICKSEVINILRPKVDIKEFEKYGFKKCKGEYGKNNCYYLCVSRGCMLIFLSKVMLDVQKWTDGDIRIHKKANCRYRDDRMYLDILYDLIKENMVESVLP